MNDINQRNRTDFRVRVNNRKFITLDCGKNSATYFDGETVFTITHQELLELPTKYPGYAFVGEDAHFGVPRTNDSLAQPFKAPELQRWYKLCRENDVILRLFPQKSTPRAKLYSKLEKSDLDDPKSIYKLVLDFQEIKLKTPKSCFESTEVQKEGHRMKSKLNKVLNYARYGDYSDQNAIWLKNNIEKLILSLSEDAKKCFNLDEATCRYKVNNKKKGFKVGDLKMNEISIPQLYSILASMQGEIDEDSLNILPNKVVRNSTGDLPSWTFAKKHLFCFSPFHQKGGVARSNLYYHGKKNWVIKQVKNKYEVNLRKKNRGEFSSEQDVVFRHYRKIYTSAIKEVFNVLRGLIQTKH
jgi:hypothetical protein